MTSDGASIPELAATQRDLLALRAELHRQRQASPTPGVAHALRLADTYLFMALGYTGYTEQFFPEQGTVDVGSEPFPHLR